MSVYPKKKRAPCGLLVNNKRCVNPKCGYSHTAFKVQRWQAEMGPSRPCRLGAMCMHVGNGCCLFWHPPEHYENCREKVMMRGIRFLASLYPNPVTDETISIVDGGDLATFNKLGDGEIAVPGEYQT